MTREIFFLPSRRVGKTLAMALARQVTADGRDNGGTFTVTHDEGSSIAVGTTITTTTGAYVVTQTSDGAPPGANRHQRRAAAAKRRHRHV